MLVQSVSILTVRGMKWADNCSSVGFWKASSGLSPACLGNEKVRFFQSRTPRKVSLVSPRTFLDFSSASLQLILSKPAYLDTGKTWTHSWRIKSNGVGEKSHEDFCRWGYMISGIAKVGWHCFTLNYYCLKVKLRKKKNESCMPIFPDHNVAAVAASKNEQC